MKTLLAVLLFIPYLSWGLTFKDGKQVPSDNENQTKIDNYLMFVSGVSFVMTMSSLMWFFPDMLHAAGSGIFVGRREAGASVEKLGVTLLQ